MRKEVWDHASPQSQGSKSLWAEAIAWAMRNHAAEHTCSRTHLYLLSHTAALMSALPNEVPRGTCSSGSSSSEQHARSHVLPSPSHAAQHRSSLLGSYAPFLSRKSLLGSASCHLTDRCSAQAHSIICTKWQPG